MKLSHFPENKWKISPKVIFPEGDTTTPTPQNPSSGSHSDALGTSVVTQDKYIELQNTVDI